MKVVFLGVGEAFDENFPNNSHLVISESVLLLDCGFSMPSQLWRYENDPDFLDAIFISHQHADHYFGLAALLARMKQENRKKPLKIICERGMKSTIMNVVEMGYASTFNSVFRIDFLEVKEGQKTALEDFDLEFAKTEHSVSNLAIRISDNQNSVCYSGDGMFTLKTENMYRNTNLLIHEAYLMKQTIPGHGSVESLLEMCKRQNVKALALTHMQRDFRKQARKIKFRENFRVIIPVPMQEYTFK